MLLKLFDLYVYGIQLNNKIYSRIKFHFTSDNYMQIADETRRRNQPIIHSEVVPRNRLIVLGFPSVPASFDSHYSAARLVKHVRRHPCQSLLCWVMLLE